MKAVIGLIAAGMVLLGCTTSAVISDIGQDKVKVVASGGDQEVIMAEARKGCALYKRTPVALSHRCLDGYCIQKEYLFACKEAG
ncbi:MAG: hypothetical protein Q8M19_14095 [Reyranella sp.]|nr:hypothetical protein [Reyranella sp.]